MQSTQAETTYTAPQHLVTNLEHKLKPYKKKTKFLRARIDTCANVNLMPISVYKLLYKDPDCQKLVPSSISNVTTYSTEKIQIVGSCDLFVLHLDTKCLQEVTFQVTSYEGNVIILCATSLVLGLIQPHTDLDVIPDKCSLMYSKADLPMKHKYKKSTAVYKLSNTVNSSKLQSHAVSNVEETEVILCMNKEVQTKSKQQQCQAPMFNDKKHQVEKCDMQPKKPKKDVQSNGSAMLIQHTMTKKSKIVLQEDDKNCQSAKYYDSENNLVKSKCSDKNCQENENIDMWPVKPQMDVLLKKPAKLQFSYKKKELKYM